MIKKEILKQKFEEFHKLKFPSEPSGMDIIAELSYDDGYIAGNVSTFLGQSPVKQPLLGVRKEVCEQIEKYEPETEEDKKYFEYLKFYIDKLEELNALLKECLSEEKI